MPSCDVIIVGGGHNGLACAAVLAKAGRKVVVFEAADQLGGAARNVDFAPGFRVSPVAHLAFQMSRAVTEGLRLAEHGLAWETAALDTTILGEDGRRLVMSGAFGERLEGDVSAQDRAAWERLRAKLLSFAALMRPLLAQAPPDLHDLALGDAAPLVRLGVGLRTMGRERMQDFLRMLLMNIADVVEDEVANPMLGGALSFDGTVGTRMGPRSPTSLMALYYRLAGEVAGRQGAVGLPRGGMGAVAAAFAGAARAAGATLRTGSPVKRILLDDEQRATGVELADGETWHAPVVASAIDPKNTFLGLVGPRALDIGFTRRIKALRTEGTVARLHLALDGLPEGTGLTDAQWRGRILVAPSIDHVERAFNPAKYGDFSDEPAMEIVVPSLSDPSLAPAGAHVLSATVMHMPYAVRGGWETRREAALAAVMATLERHLPGIGARARATEFLTPADIEARFGMPGGHWHQGEWSVSQAFLLRPTHDCAAYATPVPGLYLAGAGAHPGGGISGLPGWNAAHTIIRET